MSKEQGIEIYNNLPFDLQYYIDKMREKENLHKRLLEAQKNLEDNFIRLYSQDQDDDSEFIVFRTRNGSYICKAKSDMLITIYRWGTKRIMDVIY